MDHETPTAEDVAALGDILHAAAVYRGESDGDDVLGAKTRGKIDAVVRAFCERFVD